MTTSPDETRRRYRQIRRALAPDMLAEHADRLAGRVGALDLFTDAQRIAVYLPNDGEIGTEPLIDIAWRLGKKVYLPVLSNEAQSLAFSPYRADSTMTRNRYGIPEPDCSEQDRCSAVDLDLILMPLVAFDRHGNRLGMGGGYYDRTLVFTREKSTEQRPRLIGLAHSCQQCDSLHTNSWDIPLDAIATETEYLEF